MGQIRGWWSAVSSPFRRMPAGEGDRTSPPEPSAPLSMAELRRFRGLLFAARVVVDGCNAGRHRSPMHDRSAEFAEYRAYVPGDDVRSIDWRAVARTDRLYCRRHRKEADMTASIVLDCSGSMAYGGSGGVSKYEYASMLGAAIAYLMVMQGDRAGFVLGGDELQSFDLPSGSFQRLKEMLLTVDRTQPSGPTDLPRVLRRLQPVLRRRGLLVVVSDLLCPPAELFDALGPYLHRGFEAMLLQVLTHEEMTFPFGGAAKFVEPETGASLEADADAVAAAYRSELRAHLAELSAASRARGIGYQLLMTETPCVRALETYVTSRGR